MADNEDHAGTPQLRDVGPEDHAHFMTEFPALIRSTLREHPHLASASADEILSFLEAQRSTLLGELGGHLALGTEGLLKRYRELCGQSLEATPRLAEPDPQRG